MKFNRTLEDKTTTLPKFFRPKTFEEKVLFFSKRFLNFIKNFENKENRGSYYSLFFKENFRKNQRSLVIDLFHLSEFDTFLYFEIINSPGELMMIFDFALNGLMNKILRENKNSNQMKFRVRFINNIKSEIRKINTIEKKDFNKLITTQGVLIKCSQSTPNLVGGLFRCEVCRLETYSFPENEYLSEPIYCFNCKNFNCFQILFQRCNFSDSQFLLMGDQLDTGMSRKIPNTLVLTIRDEYVNNFQEGDLIRCTGVLRVVPYMDEEKKYKFPLIKTTLDVLHIEKIKIPDVFMTRSYWKKSLIDLKENLQTQKKIHSLGQNKKIFRMLKHSIIPDLLGIEVIKSGILCQLSKISKENSENLNTLLVGDNYSIKSRILKRSSSIKPRGLYINSKNCELKKFILYSGQKSKTQSEKITAGLIFRKDTKLCCIDGIQDFPKYLFPILKEVMNNHMVSFAQNGTIGSLEANFSLICSLNKDSEISWKENKNPFCDLPISFIRSFDIVYFISGTDSVSFDKKFAENTIENIFFDGKKKDLEKKTANDSIGFSKKSLLWFLEETSKVENFKESALLLKETIKWNNVLKKIKRSDSNEVFRKNRTMIGLIKILSEALAKQRISKVVGIEDVRNAIIKISEASKSIEFYLENSKIKLKKKENF